MASVDDHPRPPARRRSAPVWLLLAVLTLLPTLGMLGLAVVEVRRSAAEARSSSEVARDVEDVVAVLELSFGLANEQLPTQGRFRAASLGITPDVSAEVDVLAVARAATDAAYDDLGGGVLRRYPSLVDLRVRLDELRADTDAPDVDPDDIYRRYLRITTDVVLMVTPDLQELVSGDRAVDRDTTVALQGFAAAVAHHGYVQYEVVSLSEAVFDTAKRESARLAVNNALRRGELRRLTDLAVPDVRAAVDAATTDPAFVRYEELVDEVVADPTSLERVPLAELLTSFDDAFARIGLSMDVNRVAATAAVAAAQDAEASAVAASRRALVASTVILVVTVVVATAVTLSISRPLRRAAQWAGTLAGGDLAAAAPPSRGPTEARTVVGALDEVAGNLRRVAEQTAALAAGDLDDVVLASPVPGVLGCSVQASVAKLSESLRAQEELRDDLADQAHRDLLTGLPNRAGFVAAAAHALARAARSGTQIALISVDLDGFKRANDSHGHAFGDEVLQVMAARLVTAARGGDVVARLGGDEFAVIAEPVPGPEDAVALAERLRAAVAEPVEGQGRFVRVSASVGVALNQDGGEVAVDLLADADQAVQLAKRAGGDAVEVCDDALRRQVHERNEIEDALRAGIRAGELELHYQPVVDTVTGVLGGFEALVRWHRPGHGMVPPMSFIPVAEASDLVVDLGRWVLDEATSQLVAWSTEPELAHAHVAVNISGRHLLSAGVVDDVRGALERSGLDARRLVIEITETMVLFDLDVAVRHLDALRALGVRVALDDFGTGYTSIGQLGRLPVDVLKIDRSFVSDLGSRAERSIVELLVEVGHTLDLGLVAEGVEDAGQLAALTALRCDDVQGYLVSRPLPAAEAFAWALHAAPVAEH